MLCLDPLRRSTSSSGVSRPGACRSSASKSPLIVRSILSAQVSDLLRNARRGVRNALELLREGRLGAPYRASFDVVLEQGILKLRHYAGDAKGPALVLVPPLMVTSEVY